MSPKPKTYFITEAEGGQPEIQISEKRTASALDELIEAGPSGLTTLERPAPRWPSHVHKLRHRHDIDVATVTEQHGGEFAGHHARYVLRSKVRAADPLPIAMGVGVARNDNDRPSWESSSRLGVSP
jgi:winged helix domain-containing protein